MARVYFVKSPGVGIFKPSWSLYRVGTGPGRLEGHGFKTKDEARKWAAEWKHEIVEGE